MKNLMNDVDTALSESLDGFAAAHADIVVLGNDPFTVPPQDIHKIQVEMTIVGGRVVYKKD